MADPTRRFSDRVDDYVRYRPGLGRIFREHEDGDRVAIDYDTRVYWGSVAS